MKRKLICGLSALLLALLLPLATIAQVAAVSGTVSDESGNPMPGVNIVIAGTTNGTITDVNGNYSISVDAQGSLHYSFIGFQDVTEEVAGRKVINVTLADESKDVDEVVVVGYGVQRKSDVTGAIASVGANDIKGLATTDAAAALQGKAAGVQIVNTSGAPGAGANIRIRGISSNSDNLGPLLIVDGLQVDNIQYLDPSMIESMEILKDAASAAIYGAQAGNGVVLITTKSGSANAGQPKVIYSFKGTNQSLGKTPEVFGAKDYIKYKEMQGIDMKSVCQGLGIDYNNPAETDWLKEVFDNSWATQHNLTFQGGNKEGHFFASVNYVKNDGIVRGKKDTYERLTGQINADYKLYDWIKVSSNNSIEKWTTKGITHQGQYGSMLAPALQLDPLAKVYWTEDELTQAMKDKLATDPDFIIKAPNGLYYGSSKLFEDNNGNPLLQLQRRNNRSGGANLRGTTSVDITPIKGLTLTSRLNYRISHNTAHNYEEPYFMNNQAKADNYNISADANNSIYYQWENFINFNRTFADKHSVGAMVGMSYSDNSWDNVNASASGNEGAQILSGTQSNFQYLSYVNSASTTTKNIGNAPGSGRSMAYFGRLTYNYDNRYNLQFNLRADAFDSSKLPSDSRWGTFPSVAAGWTISNESFIKDNISPEILSYAKVRASWGQNGNISVLQNYPYSTTIALNSTYAQYGGTPDQHYGSKPSGQANPDLKWETSEQFDLGFDFRFLNDRLSLGIDYFNKNTKDLLVDINPCPEVFVGTTTVNAGEVNNKGLEFELGWKDSIGDLHYGVKGNLSTLKNEVTYLYDDIERIVKNQGGVDGTNNRVHKAFEKGHSIWYFRAFDYAGVDSETGKPLFYNAAGQKVGSSELTDDDFTDIGSPIPDVTYGITLNLEWKGIDLTIFGTGVAGNKIFNIQQTHTTAYRNSLKYYMDNAWTPTNKGASMPNPAEVVNDQNFYSSSASLFDGNYFKIKQIQLGYSLPKSIIGKIAMKECRLFVSLDDFFTFTDYPGLDPETATTSSVSGQGFDVGSYPTMKKVSFGATIAF